MSEKQLRRAIVELRKLKEDPWVPVDKYEGLQEGAAYVVRQVYTHSPGDERVVVLDYMGRGYWKRGVNEDEPDGDSDWEVTHVHLVGRVA